MDPIHTVHIRCPDPEADHHTFEVWLEERPGTDEPFTDKPEYERHFATRAEAEVYADELAERFNAEIDIY
jgi:hypothetical protein